LCCHIRYSRIANVTDDAGFGKLTSGDAALALPHAPRTWRAGSLRSGQPVSERWAEFETAGQVPSLDEDVGVVQVVKAAQGKDASRRKRRSATQVLVSVGN